MGYERNIIRSHFHRLIGALKSGNKAAYLGLLIKAVRLITIPFDRFLSHVGPESKDVSIPSCVLIVSPPRSGSTIAFQLVSRCLDCRYISNLHALFPRNAFSFKKPSMEWKEKAGFDNYYGYTGRLKDVYEANEIFDYLIQVNDPQEIRRRFRLFVKGVKKGKTTVLMKNVRSYNKIRLLAEAVPELKFLMVKRDLFQNIQSEYRAFKELKTFHPQPPALKHIDYRKEPVRYAVEQIQLMRTTIESQLQELAPDRYRIISYEDLCFNPGEIIADLGIWLSVSVNNYYATANLSVSNQIKVNELERRSILSWMQASKNLIRDE